MVDLSPETKFSPIQIKLDVMWKLKQLENQGKINLNSQRDLQEFVYDYVNPFSEGNKPSYIETIDEANQAIDMINNTETFPKHNFDGMFKNETKIRWANYYLRDWLYWMIEKWIN